MCRALFTRQCPPPAAADSSTVRPRKITLEKCYSGFFTRVNSLTRWVNPAGPCSHRPTVHCRVPVQVVSGPWSGPTESGSRVASLLLSSFAGLALGCVVGPTARRPPVQRYLNSQNTPVGLWPEAKLAAVARRKTPRMTRRAGREAIRSVFPGPSRTGAAMSFCVRGETKG
jgi:hypothetical protein